jgi:protease PrsW
MDILFGYHTPNFTFPGVPEEGLFEQARAAEAAGFDLGFAAFESSGYAFSALFTPRGLSLFSLVYTEVLRGVLAPLGHGLWTAILGGVLFEGASRRGHLALTGRLFLVYLAVTVLHGLWDSMRGIAIVLTLLTTNSPALTVLSNCCQRRYAGIP